MSTLNSKIIKWSRQFYNNLCIGNKKYLNGDNIMYDLRLIISKIFDSFMEDLEGNVNEDGELKSEFINLFCMAHCHKIQKPLLVLTKKYVSDEIRHISYISVSSLLNNCVVEYIKSCGLKIVD
jgi:hypothetical protein